jgi:hypothetical protein
MLPFRPRLIEWLQALALSAEEQVQFLKEIGGQDYLYLPVDELALEYYEIILLLDQYREAANISEAAEAALRDLDKHFQSFSGHVKKELWAYDALSKQPIWETARVKARQCLVLLGEQVSPVHSAT